MALRDRKVLVKELKPQRVKSHLQKYFGRYYKVSNVESSKECVWFMVKSLNKELKSWAKIPYYANVSFVDFNDKSIYFIVRKDMYWWFIDCIEQQEINTLKRCYEKK